MNSIRKRVAIIVSLVLAVSSFGTVPRLHAQQSAQRKLPQILRDSDYALRRFKEVTSQIDFDTWQKNIAATNSARTLLSATLSAADEGQRHIDEIQQGQASVSELFELYDDLDYAASTSGSLSTGVEVHLSTDLLETATLLTKSANSLRPYVAEAIRELETHVRACSSSQK
jgi:hypothetical protein